MLAEPWGPSADSPTSRFDPRTGALPPASARSATAVHERSRSFTRPRRHLAPVRRIRSRRCLLARIARDNADRSPPSVPLGRAARRKPLGALSFIASAATNSTQLLPAPSGRAGSMTSDLCRHETRTLQPAIFDARGGPPSRLKRASSACRFLANSLVEAVVSARSRCRSRRRADHRRRDQTCAAAIAHQQCAARRLLSRRSSHPRRRRCAAAIGAMQPRDPRTPHAAPGAKRQCVSNEGRSCEHG
jgi:hypothetical protein